MQAEQPKAGQKPGHGGRVLLAAGVGVLAAVVLLVLTRLLVSSASCRDAPGYGCLGVYVLWSETSVVLTFPLAWILLLALRIRTAWLVALLGTGLCWYLTYALPVLQQPFGGLQNLRFAVGAMAFALAAWAVRPRPQLWPRAATAVGLVLLMPINSFASTLVSRANQDSQLTASHVLLLGPQVPAGYELGNGGTEPNTLGTTFSYVVSPHFPGKGAVTMAQLNQQITVTVGPALPQFTPPTHCTALTDVFPPPEPACTAVIPGVWLSARAHYDQYFVRVGDYVAVVAAFVPQASTAALREVATTLKPRDPSYFAGG